MPEPTTFAAFLWFGDEPIYNAPGGLALLPSPLWLEDQDAE